MPLKKLTDYLVKEVSLVDDGAVQEKFLLLKQKGGNVMGALLDKIQKLEIDSDKIREMTAQFNLGEDEKSILEGFMRFYKIDKSDGLIKAMRAVTKESDPPKEEPPVVEPPKEPEPSEEVKTAIEKEKVSAKAKLDEVTKEKEKLQTEKDKLDKENKELKEKEDKSKFLEIAKTYKKLSIMPEKFAELLRVSKCSLPDEIYKELERILKSADAALELSKDVKDIYGEIGTDKDGGNPKAELEKLIEEEMKLNPKISRQKATVNVASKRPDMIKVINEKGDK